MFKLRYYYTKGINKGDFKKEEFFNTLEELDIRYKEVYKEDLLSLNPTAWDNDKRLLGYY